MQNVQGIILPIAFLVIFYFLAIRPQQKREKEIRQMREALAVGDEIVTIGGIYGKVVKVKEDIITIEVGSDKVKMNFAKWAVGSVVKKKESQKDKSKQKEKEKKVDETKEEPKVEEKNNESDESENKEEKE